MAAEDVAGELGFWAGAEDEDEDDIPGEFVITLPAAPAPVTAPVPVAVAVTPDEVELPFKFKELCLIFELLLLFVSSGNKKSELVGDVSGELKD